MKRTNDCQGEGSVLSKDYLAGLVDGEGSIGLYSSTSSRTTAGNRVQYWRPTIQLGLVGEHEKALLSLVQRAYGGHAYEDQRRDGRIVQVWSIRSAKLIKNFLAEIGHRLILKRSQADLMLAFCLLPMPRKGPKAEAIAARLKEIKADTLGRKRKEV